MTALHTGLTEEKRNNKDKFLKCQHPPVCVCAYIFISYPLITLWKGFPYSQNKRLGLNFMLLVMLE